MMGAVFLQLRAGSAFSAPRSLEWVLRFVGMRRQFAMAACRLRGPSSNDVEKPTAEARLIAQNNVSYRSNRNLIFGVQGTAKKKKNGEKKDSEKNRGTRREGLRS